jgi:hypothetical protein
VVRAETPPGLDPGIAKARETLRFEAAEVDAPYVHARLQTMTLVGNPEKPLKVDSMDKAVSASLVCFPAESSTEASF